MIFMKNYYFFLIFLLFLFACKNKENIIESEIPPQKWIFVSEENPNSLQTLELPSIKVNNEDLFFLANNKKLDEIDQIVEFRNLMFIFQSNSYKITIVSSDSFKIVAELDWIAKKKKPSSIAFTNATTAFISFSNDSTLQVLDLTNFFLARVINVPEPIIRLECIEYYIVGISFNNGKLIVVDSRTFSLVQQLELPEHPIDISIHPLKEFIYVLCLGKGKLDSTEVKTLSKLISITYPEFTILHTKEISLPNINSVEILTNALEVAGKFFGFISSNYGLIRFSVANPDQIQKYIAGNFISLTYIYKIDRLMAIERKSSNQFLVYLINPQNAAIDEKYIINFPLRLLLPK